MKEAGFLPLGCENLTISGNSVADTHAPFSPSGLGGVGYVQVFLTKSPRSRLIAISQLPATRGLTSGRLLKRPAGMRTMPTLEFKGKHFICAHHHSVPFKELVVNAKKSPYQTKPAPDDNPTIHGNNLHALKILIPGYAGKVTGIYRDPRYNTGSEGGYYNDNSNSPLRQFRKYASCQKKGRYPHERTLLRQTSCPPPSVPCSIHNKASFANKWLPSTGPFFLNQDKINIKQ